MYKYTFAMLLAKLLAVLLGFVLGCAILLTAWEGIGFRGTEMVYVCLVAVSIWLAFLFFLLVTLRGK